jgi:hypothetical protein
MDRNIVDIQLIPLDKKKEQVERPFELGELNLIGCGVLHACALNARIRKKVDNGSWIVDSG